MTVLNNLTSIELFTLGEPSTDLVEWVATLPHVKNVSFESNPNKEHDSIWVDVVVDEEMIEEVIENIENSFYDKDEVINAYEYYNSLNK